jgi:2-phospho-L-lactate guanylyltransferase
LSEPGIWCLIPVKRLKNAKQRLAAVLTQEQRETLTRMMATDVIRTALASDRLAGVAVVTSEEEVAALARQEGAIVLAEEAESGLNAAVTGATATVLGWGATGILILPGDVPLVSASDISEMLEGHGHGYAVTIAPADEDGGSNALACSPPDAIPFCFGEDSRARHSEAACRAGIEPKLRRLPGLALDIDRPTDLGAMLAKISRTMTYGYLSQLDLGALAKSATGMTIDEA